jgi:hypothetical protein
MQKFILSATFFIISLACFSQESSFNDDSVKAKLKRHITRLASDQYEGRETGSNGEKLSYQYIIMQLLRDGLTAKGDKKNFLQKFPFTKGTEFGKKTFLSVNGKSFKITDEFYPLAFSKNDSIESDFVNAGFGISAPSLDYDDYKKIKSVEKKIVVINSSTPDSSNPHGKFSDYLDLKLRVEEAVKHDAWALIFVNPDTAVENPKFDFSHKISPVSIPVIFAKGDAAKAILENANAKIKLVVELNKIEETGHNVLAYIDNHSSHIIIIGAHYDHLGYGGEESLYRGDPQIHNGADDNASGTAALIELAHYFKNSKDTNNNYLFIAFSGEEKGLLGSNYFIKHPTIDLSSVTCMLNMDMVGRLKPEQQTLIINGVGTSPAWKDLMKNIEIDSMKIKTTESGVGPSDHTSFYLDSIPVLHFFSGTHSDYHKPSDDEPLINYDGETKIIRYMIQLIEKIDKKNEKLLFTKTNDSNNDDAPRFKVTLGVVPDYAFDGEGMRIDGVTDGKPASKAGLLKGDVVIQLGENKVTDMMSYMKALGKFSKGDKTKVKVKRDKEDKEFDITF